MTSQSDLEGNTIEARSETNRRQARWWDGSTYEMAQGWSWITIIIKLNFKQNITLYYDDHKAKDTTMIITAVYEVKYSIRASCFFFGKIWLLTKQTKDVWSWTWVNWSPFVNPKWGNSPLPSPPGTDRFGSRCYSGSIQRWGDSKVSWRKHSWRVWILYKA